MISVLMNFKAWRKREGREQRMEGGEGEREKKKESLFEIEDVMKG